MSLALERVGLRCRSTVKEMNYCSSCGTRQEGWGRFCRACGVELTVAILPTAKGQAGRDSGKPPFLARRWGQCRRGRHLLHRMPLTRLKRPLKPPAAGRPTPAPGRPNINSGCRCAGGPGNSSDTHLLMARRDINGRHSTSGTSVPAGLNRSASTATPPAAAGSVPATWSSSSEAGSSTSEPLASNQLRSECPYPSTQKEALPVRLPTMKPLPNAMRGHVPL